MVSTGFDHVVLATHPLAQQVLDNRNIDNNKYFPADKLHFRIEFVPLRINVARRWVMHSAPKIVHGANYWPNHHPSRIVVVVPRFAPWSTVAIAIWDIVVVLRFPGGAQTADNFGQDLWVGIRRRRNQPSFAVCVCVCVIQLSKGRQLENRMSVEIDRKISILQWHNW